MSKKERLAKPMGPLVLAIIGLKIEKLRNLIKASVIKPHLKSVYHRT